MLGPYFVLNKHLAVIIFYYHQWYASEVRGTVCDISWVKSTSDNSQETKEVSTLLWLWDQACAAWRQAGCLRVCQLSVCFPVPPLTDSQSLLQTVTDETCAVLMGGGGVVLLKSHFPYSAGKIFLLKHCLTWTEGFSCHSKVNSLEMQAWLYMCTWVG